MIILINSLLNKSGVNKIISKPGIKFLYYNLISTLIFTCLYIIVDIIYSIEAKNYSDYCYWLWFSLISQTTVGYNSITDNKGNSINWINNNMIFKMINILQLISIFIITAMSI
tara:strand:+ start:13217 stop:13555 length:339 start_codon:yes stop_codon:yes gene_type:complete